MRYIGKEKRVFLLCALCVFCISLAGCRAGADGLDAESAKSAPAGDESGTRKGTGGASKESGKDNAVQASEETDLFADEADYDGEKTQIVLSTFSEWRSRDDDGNEILSDTERLVAEFNAKSRRYEIVFRIGADEGMDYADYYNRLNAELIAGDGPDLFCASTNALFPQLVQKNVIEDLKPYMDRDLNEDDYLKNILYVFEKDGSVYALEHSFNLHPYIFEEAVSKGRERLSVSDIKEILADDPGIVSYNGEGAMSVLYECCMFWGWDPADMEQLREYVLFAEQYGKELDPAVPGEGCLTGSLQLSQADSLKAYERRLRMNGTVKKDAEKKFSLVFSVGDSGYCLQEGNAFSINAASKNKEGSWKFIRFILSKEMQKKIQPYKVGPDSRTVYHTGFPVRTEQFEEALREAMTEADYSEEQKIGLGYEDGRVKLNVMGTECLTEDEAETIRKMADRSQVIAWSANATPCQIVFEEISYYFDHSKKLDECLGIIENRIRLYLLEQ